MRKSEIEDYILFKIYFVVLVDFLLRICNILINVGLFLKNKIIQVNDGVESGILRVWILDIKIF